MLTSFVSKISTSLMNIGSSAFSNGFNFSNFIMAPFAAVGNATINIVGKIMSFLYFIFKWVLYFVDIVFTYVQQLCGLNMDLSSLQAATSGDSDLIFNFLWSASSYVTRLVRALIIIAVIVIILLSIFAVIRTQFESLSKGTPADIGQVIKNMFKSFVMLLLTPFIAIFGIIASNAVLQALYNATNVSNCASLSTQIFVASATSANSFRLYAQNGRRVPIMYNFENEEAIMDYYDGSKSNSAFSQFLTSTKNSIYTTYLLFDTGEFLTYNSLIDEEELAAYHTIYDVGSTANFLGDPYADIRKIENYASEYFVMADLVEFCIKSTTPVYYKTIQEVLESAANLPDESIAQRNLSAIVQNFNIRFQSRTGNDVNFYNEQLLEDFKSDEWGRIVFQSKYFRANEAGEPAYDDVHTYVHAKDETDEIQGAKYVIATERAVEIDGVTYTYYYPLTSGDVGSYGMNFTSEYIAPGQIVSAKGIFETGVYPTAIKQNANGDIVFYRDKIEDCYTGQFGDMANLSYQNQEGGGLVSKLMTFFNALINPASLVPNLDYDADAVAMTYQRNVSEVNTLSGGRFHIGYMFSDFLTTGLLKGNYTLDIENLFQPMKINYLIFVSCAILLVKVVFTAMAALINRIYELFLVIIFYPTACATIPVTNQGYNSWLKTYMSRVLSTYGIILGINFLFILFPIISTIQVFTPSMVATKKFLRKFTFTIFGSITINQAADILNFATNIMFEVVAFTFITKIPELIDGLVGGRGLSQNNPLESLRDGILNMTAAGKVVKMVTGKPIGAAKKVLTAKGREELKESMMKNIPGSAIASAAKDKKSMNDAKKKQKDAEMELKLALSDPKNFDGSDESKKLIEDKLKELRKAQKNYTDALRDPHGYRKKEEAKLKEKRDSGLLSREEDDLDENGIDVSSLSNRDLRKRKRKASKIVKNLEKKKKKYGEDALTDEEEASLATYTNIRDSVKSEKKGRKGEGKDRKTAKKRVKELEEKQNSGATLTDDEQRELDSGRDTLNLKKDRRAASKADKRRVKEGRKLNKEEEKREEREKKENRKFQRTGFGSKRSQNRALKKYDKRSDEIVQGLYKTGFAGAANVDQMTDDELNDQIVNANKYGNTKDQVALLTALQNNRTRQQELMGINTTSIQNKQQMNQVRRNYKDDDIAGYGGHNAFKRHQVKSRTRNSADTSEDEAEYAKLQAEIDLLRQGGLSNSRDRNRYRRLINKQAAAKQRVDASNTWNERNNSEYRAQVDAERARYRRGENNYRNRTEEMIEDGGDYDYEQIHKNAVKHTQQRKKKKNDEE